MTNARKIRPKGSGTAEWRYEHWFVKVSLPDGTRTRYRLCGEICDCKQMSEARRQEKCAAISERVRTELQADMARAQRKKATTVREFGESWTSGKLYESHGEVNALRIKKSAKNDAHRLAAYVYPVIGAMPVARITEEDIERTVAQAAQKARKKLGRPWRKASRFQLYQVLRRMFDLAIRPGRLREDNPVSESLRPTRDDAKLFGFLYPSEMLQILACRTIPIERRVLYALACYTGLRKGSLYALTWRSVDFTHRTLTSLQSKTGLPQMFEIQPTLAALLTAWNAYRGGPTTGQLVPRVPAREREARILRDDLQAAGVKRETLFGTADNVQPIRFHDLRATFTTWAFREGRGDGWISDRTGHLTQEMRSRYTRAARVLADLSYEPFPSLDGAIPEFAEVPSNVVLLRRPGS